MTYNQENHTYTLTEREYQDMYDDVRLLDCARRAGVDNLEGWEYALDLYHGEDEE